MTVKRIVILANSKKHAERCVAGKDISGQQPGDWIRPVSARPSEGLNLFERRCTNGTDPTPFDIVDVQLVRPNPHTCQTENWLTSSSGGWIHAGRLTWDQAAELAESPPTLWHNGRSTYNGQNDEVPAHVGQALPNSLTLIRVPAITINVISSFEKKKVRGDFIYGGVRYNFSVTDMTYLGNFIQQPEGTSQTLGESLLTISLAEPYTKSDGSRCQYKLVAGVMPR